MATQFWPYVYPGASVIDNRDGAVVTVMDVDEWDNTIFLERRGWRSADQLTIPENAPRNLVPKVGDLVYAGGRNLGLVTQMSQSATEKPVLVDSTQFGGASYWLPRKRVNVLVRGDELTIQQKTAEPVGARIGYLKNSLRGLAGRATPAATRVSQVLLNMMDTGIVESTNPIPWWFALTIAESVDSPQQVSWADRPEVVLDDGRRKRGRWSVFLKRIVKDFGIAGITDKDIEAFAYAVGECFPTKRGFSYEIMEGDGLIETYRSTAHSCMQGMDEYVAWYAENPKTVKIVRISEDRAFGRALLWHMEDGSICLDRIYPNSGRHVDWMIAQAKANGWDWKDNQGFDVPNFHSGTKRVAKMRRPSRGKFPYLDTLYYADDVTNPIITISNREFRGGDYIRYTNGTCTHDGHNGLLKEFLDDDDPMDIHDVLDAQEAAVEAAAVNGADAAFLASSLGMAQVDPTDVEVEEVETEETAADAEGYPTFQVNDQFLYVADDNDPQF